jgi:hypothetical protein
MSADCPRCIGGNLLWNRLTHCFECLQCGYSKEVEVECRIARGSKGNHLVSRILRSRRV